MKCFVAITCVLALAASVKADGLGLAGLGGHGLVYAPGHASVDYYSYPRYAFEYAVKDPHTGDNKAQWEKRDGDVVKGAYSLVEPDGSLRVVEYWADDKSGFNAVVKRIGPNLHPVAAPVAPIYKAPIPVLESHGPIAPISVGPVAKYVGLADAPLITGPHLGGGTVSSAAVYRPPVVPIVKAPIVAAPAPILHEPVAHHAPIAHAPAPIIAAPVYKAPIISAPVYKAPIISAPVYKAPIISAPLPYNLGLGGNGYHGGAGNLGGIGHLDGAGHLGSISHLDGAGHLGAGHYDGLGHLGYGAGLIKAQYGGHGYLEDLGHGLLNKGIGYGHNDYLGGYKH